MGDKYLESNVFSDAIQEIPEVKLIEIQDKNENGTEIDDKQI